MEALDAPIPELTVDEVEAQLETSGFFVFDTNHASRWKRSHVPTARNVNPHRFAPEDLVPADPGSTLVFYCSGPG